MFYEFVERKEKNNNKKEVRKLNGKVTLVLIKVLFTSFRQII